MIAVKRSFNLLFLCTGNSARSIMAEVILRDCGQGRFAAYSAGSQPKHAPHAQALATLAAYSHETQDLRSKSWDEFEQSNAPKIDIVISLCDHAAAENCPVFMKAAIRAHWGLPDPAASDDRAVAVAFTACYEVLQKRINALLSLHDGEITPQNLQAIAVAD